MKTVRLFELDQKGDENGHLVAAEGKGNIPFEIKRVFFIYGSDKDVVRGSHANKKSEFVLINVSGSSKIRVRSPGGYLDKVYCLDRPNLGLYLPNMVWKDMYDFSADSVLMVLASEIYDASEYIKDYNVFLKETEVDAQ